MNIINYILNFIPLYRSLNYPIEVRIKSIIGNGYGDKTLHLRKLTTKKGETIMDCFEENIPKDKLPPPPTGALRLRLANMPWNLGGLSGEMNCVDNKYNWLVPTVDFKTYFSKDSGQMEKMYTHLMSNYERNKVRNEETNKMMRETMLFCTIILIVGIIAIIGVSLFVIVNLATGNERIITGIADQIVKGITDGFKTVGTLIEPIQNPINPI